ncbi:DUF6412 domain-containing protein [Nocardia sp. NPDC051030]|uniref:DUF6412 domain-containing protein n=1 Tax=Nocardia sp. NPDC051030 TaxID=3155162 RepID=UPI00341283F9
MITRGRALALMVLGLVMSAWAVIGFGVAEPNSLVVLGAAAILVLSAGVLLAARGPMVAIAGSSGPPESARRRRRGAFLRQSNPDTAGRVRARAPGLAAA